MLARLLRGRIPPGVRRLMWLLVLIRLLCPWSISGGLLDRGTAELRQAARDMSVHRLVWHIYNTFHLLGVFGAMDGGGERR